jgi:DNA-binding MarR family transcriptional regulator
MLKPTLWRTCRVLANHRRLILFWAVANHPCRSVAELAELSGLKEEVASVYLRKMEARGLLDCRRSGRFVLYSVGLERNDHPSHPLVLSLHRLFFRARSPDWKQVFRLATAFTHPRRIEIFRVLRKEFFPTSEIRSQTGISNPALNRHLRKLHQRGFAVVCRGRCRRSNPPGDPSRVWAKLAEAD